MHEAQPADSSAFLAIRGIQMVNFLEIQHDERKSAGDT